MAGQHMDDSDVMEFAKAHYRTMKNDSRAREVGFGEKFDSDQAINTAAKAWDADPNALREEITREENEKAKPKFASGGMMAPGPMAPQGPQAGAPGDPAAPVNPNTAASTPDETADNVDAKLSGGEFVVPAFAVKYFGIDKFHKMVKSAEQGIAEMHQAGMIKGGAPDQGDSQGPAPVHAADGALIQNGIPGGNGLMSPNAQNCSPINMATGGFLMRPMGHKPHTGPGDVPGPTTTSAMAGKPAGLSKIWKDFAQKFGAST